jgi:hypothetical protein
VRTDNEAMFTSRLWRRVLGWLRVRRQRSAPGRPWQNGRIERLFGTVKPWLRSLVAADAGTWQLQRTLDLAALFYNEQRPHQALDGLTPMHAWLGMTWSDVERMNGTLTRKSEPLRCWQSAAFHKESARGSVLSAWRRVECVRACADSRFTAGRVIRFGSSSLIAGRPSGLTCGQAGKKRPRAAGGRCWGHPDRTLLPKMLPHEHDDRQRKASLRSATTGEVVALDGSAAT